MVSLELLPSPSAEGAGDLLEAATAIALKRHCVPVKGSVAPCSTKGCRSSERDKASACFAQAEGGAQVLLCSEIGSEVATSSLPAIWALFDLPLNPDCWNSVSGRLIRIGQQNTVEIHVSYLEGLPSAPAALVSRWPGCVRADLPDCAPGIRGRCVTSCSSCWPPTPAIRQGPDALLVKTREPQ